MPGAASGRSPQAVRRIVRIGILVLLVPLAGYVAVALLRGTGDQPAPPPAAPPRPEPVPAEVPGEDPPEVSSEMREFRFRSTVEGEPLYTLDAARLAGTEANVQYLEDVRRFRIHHRDGGDVTVTAGEGRLLLGEGANRALAGITLSGGVEAETARGERLNAPEAEYRDEDRTLTAFSPAAFETPDYSGKGTRLDYGLDEGRIVVSGPVEITWAAGPMAGWRLTASRAVRAGEDADTLLHGPVRAHRGEEWISADGARIAGGRTVRRTLFEGAVRGRLASPAAGAGERGGGETRRPVAFAADVLDVSRASEGAPPVARLTGSARIVAEAGPAPRTDPVAAGPVAGRVTLDGPEILIRFNALGEPESVEGVRRSTLLRETPSGPETVLADRIVLEPEPEPGHSPSVTAAARDGWSGRASGDVRIDAPGGRAGGREAEFGPSGVVLEGDRPWAVSGPRRVRADRIERLARSGDLLASGNVRVHGEEAASKAPGGNGLPLPGDGGPVEVASDRARFSEGGAAGTGPRVSRFEGRVRAWRGTSSLQAETLVVEGEGDRSTATGGVIVRGTRASDASPAGTSWSIASDEMLHEESAGSVLFTGGAIYEEPGSVLRARTIEGIRSEDGTDDGAFDRLHARGDVEFVSGSRRGTGESADYMTVDRRVVLVGGDRPARLVDDGQGQSYTGPSLTLDLAANNIAVLSGDGERAGFQFDRPEDRDGNRRR